MGKRVRWQSWQSWDGCKLTCSRLLGQFWVTFSTLTTSTTQKKDEPKQRAGATPPPPRLLDASGCTPQGIPRPRGAAPHPPAPHHPAHTRLGSAEDSLPAFHAAVLRQMLPQRSGAGQSQPSFAWL